MLNHKLFYLCLLAIVIVVAGFFIWQMKAYKVPEPKYSILQTSGNIEVRQYPSLIIAQVAVEGERYTAINTGFKILADYIFGNNQIKTKIAMTAPVIQQNMKISMAAPVSQQQLGNIWNIRFIMPANFTLNTLPNPNDQAITLLQQPSKKYAVIRFAGTNTQSNLDQHQQMLLDYIHAHQLKSVGTPIYAFYNPPWILPFLRRNEIMMEIR